MRTMPGTIAPAPGPWAGPGARKHPTPGKSMNKYVGRLLWAAVATIAPVAGAQAQVVVSQVYGGGGNSGATLKSDFIELRNNGATAVNLAGWSVQYASAA